MANVLVIEDRAMLHDSDAAAAGAGNPIRCDHVATAPPKPTGPPLESGSGRFEFGAESDLVGPAVARYSDRTASGDRKTLGDTGSPRCWANLIAVRARDSGSKR
jgi:hypothetical protein